MRRGFELDRTHGAHKNKTEIKKHWLPDYTLPLESRPKPNTGGGTTLVYKTTAVNRQK